MATMENSGRPLRLQLVRASKAIRGDNVRFVNVCEDTGSITLLSERGERPGASVDTTEADGQDRDLSRQRISASGVSVIC